MLSTIRPEKVKFFCACIYRNYPVYTEALIRLQRAFGPIDLESKTLSFAYTSYYNEEMGTPLYRRFVSFKRLRDSSRIARTKLVTIRIEKLFSQLKKRQINIDPGYLTLAKLVLLSTKDFYHRIHLQSGIHAEATLKYTKNDFVDYEWTYPDYKTPEYKVFFRHVRTLYKAQLKKSLPANEK